MSHLSVKDTTVVNRLIRFGRRPLVYVETADDTDTSVLSYARRVAEHYRRGGLHVTRQSSAHTDYHVRVSRDDIAHGQVCILFNSKKMWHSMQQGRTYMTRCWPMNAIKACKRAYTINMEQLDVLIEHYTDQASVLQRLYVAQQRDRVLYETAALVYQRLMSLEPTTESFERSHGQELFRGDVPAPTIAVHVQYRLTTALLDALQRATPVLLAHDAERMVLPRMARPVDPVEWFPVERSSRPAPVTAILTRTLPTQATTPSPLQITKNESLASVSSWPTLPPAPVSWKPNNGMMHLNTVLAQLSQQARIAVGGTYRLF